MQSNMPSVPPQRCAPHGQREYAHQWTDIPRILPPLQRIQCICHGRTRELKKAINCSSKVRSGAIVIQSIPCWAKKESCEVNQLLTKLRNAVICCGARISKQSFVSLSRSCIHSSAGNIFSTASCTRTTTTSCSAATPDNAWLYCALAQSDTTIIND